MTPAGGGSGRSGALRRYPALAYLAGAVALALLLPSGLTLPNSGPSTLAEYAPVPGEGQGRSDVAEFGETSSSGGPGSGRRGAAPAHASTDAGGESEDRAGRIVRKAGTKRCVGDPPRQTEDPLSPPCVAFFEGDNFGTTGKGVTKDEVAVAIHTDADLSAGSGVGTYDCAQAPKSDDHPNVVFCKAFWRYFNERYQTYDRNVRLFLVRGERFDTVDGRRPMFAWLGNQDGGEAVKAKTINVTFGGSSRTSYQTSAPYRISYRPDLEDLRTMLATYICNRLAGRPARFAGDPAMHTRERRFAIWYEDDQRSHRDAVEKAMLERCGVGWSDEQQGANARNDAAEAVTGAARLRNNGITTVFVSASSPGFAAAAATQAGFFPEWITSSTSSIRWHDQNNNARQIDQSQWRNAIGVTVDIRRATLEEQPWFRAYREGCPDCPKPDSQFGALGPQFYDMLSLLFYGIQAAGPRLTPHNLDKGLHAIPQRGSPEPFKPAAYFAPGNYSYIKDAMAIWWDPAGQPPGGASPGCYRLPEEGKRYRAGEWSPNDAIVRAPGPCQADTVG